MIVDLPERAIRASRGHANIDGVAYVRQHVADGHTAVETGSLNRQHVEPAPCVSQMQTPADHSPWLAFGNRGSLN